MFFFDCTTEEVESGTRSCNPSVGQACSNSDRNQHLGGTNSLVHSRRTPPFRPQTSTLLLGIYDLVDGSPWSTLVLVSVPCQKLDALKAAQQTVPATRLCTRRIPIFRTEYGITEFSNATKIRCITYNRLIQLRLKKEKDCISSHSCRKPLDA